MAKREWYILLEDFDQKLTAIVGPFNEGDDDSDWIDNVRFAEKNGRDIRWQYFQPNQQSEITSYVSGKQFAITTPENIIEVPVDRSNEYRGKLPQYAARANRKRVIKIFCKGKCTRTVWAELNVDYPGKEIVKKAEMGEFTAKCLKCGKVADDNYNWHCR